MTIVSLAYVVDTLDKAWPKLTVSVESPTGFDANEWGCDAVMLDALDDGIRLAQKSAFKLPTAPGESHEPPLTLCMTWNRRMVVFALKIEGLEGRERSQLRDWARQWGGSLQDIHHPDADTTFSQVCVTCPVEAVRKNALSGASPEGRPERWKPSESATILVVDDEDLVLSVAALLLKRAGFNVLTAESGSMALQVFQKQSSAITCVLLDLSMPDMNGLEVLEEMRKVRSDTRVIVSSGFSEHSLDRSRYSENVVGVLYKPYDGNQLLSTVRAALEKL